MLGKLRFGVFYVSFYLDWILNEIHDGFLFQLI